uniref:Uncharacterized protein n=1 Tax=Arundo donax TaxID=35708 RepID=A0A0A8Z9F2_ARUDO
MLVCKLDLLSFCSLVHLRCLTGTLNLAKTNERNIWVQVMDTVC